MKSCCRNADCEAGRGGPFLRELNREAGDTREGGDSSDSSWTRGAGCWGAQRADLRWKTVARPPLIIYHFR